MQNELQQQAEQYKNRNRRHKLWRRVIGGLAFVVVFCTTYVLIRPAITLEQTAYCGLEEHCHGPECFEKRLICGYDGDTESLETSEGFGANHVHTDNCYEERQVLICGQTEGPGHVHNEGCVQTGQPLVHTENHKHTDDCYEERQVLICQQAETPGHIHDESCVRTELTLVCMEDHEHTDDCYQSIEIYTCGLTEGEGAHTHGPECYETQRVLICNHTETNEVPAAPPYICGMTEGEGAHTHGPECYETQRVLICNHTEAGEIPATPSAIQSSPQDNHVHTDACYEEILICEKLEHTHTLACFSNPKADVESREVWERTVAGVELTGVWADDLVAIAQSQLGYEESTANYIVMDDGETIKGYNRYGAWYGASYSDWCAMFVSFCLNYAEIPKTVIPYEASCSSWANILSASDWNLYRNAEEYIPVKGDIIFFDHDGDGSPNHVGIVAEYSIETAQIKTIEGNSANKVQYVTYAIDNSKICGYGALPKQENSVALETTKTALIYTDGTYETPLEDETVITLTGIIPQEAEVRAFPVTVETEQQVLCAYDISIVMPDGTLYEPAEGEKINVAIQTPELSDDETVLNTTAYYIPEDSAPVPMDTSFHEDGTVSFETDHFSVYALMRSGTMSEVYINGATGNDDNAGTQAAPVKTLEKALSLAAENGIIYVSGTITVSSAENWSIDVAGVTMQRAPGFNETPLFTGPLVSVASGGSLTLSNITMNGGNNGLNALLINGNSSYSTNYSATSAKAPLIVVNSGGALTITDGTVLENNSNKPDTYNNAFRENGYVGLGGAVYSNGTLTMTGGLIQHCEAQSGGGIYVENSSPTQRANFNLSGGTIYHNFARDIQTQMTPYRTNAGGGVYVGDYSNMVMSGGAVSNNQSSREGGGISLGWLNRAYSWDSIISEYITTFTMTGGIITENEALSTGGGLNVAAGREATISAGHITYNKAYGHDSQASFRVFSGGGIYVDASHRIASNDYRGKPGKLILHRVVITQNHSDYQGGGIAACPTGESNVNFNLGNGTAIYNNTAMPSVGSYDEIGIQSTDPNASNFVTDTVLGGGEYNWQEYESGVWTNYYNPLTDSSPAIITAKSLATVWITNNHGYLGGGIGNNGIIEIGGQLDDTTISITITKEWVGENIPRPDYIAVQILQDGEPYGDLIKIYKTIDSNNQEIWPTCYVDGLPGGHTYTIEEVPIFGYSSEVTANENNFTITNTSVDFGVVKKWVGDEEANRPDSIEVQLLQNGTPYGEPVLLDATNNWSYFWTDLPETDEHDNPCEYSVQEIDAPDGYYISSSELVPESGMWEITNTKIETTTISAEKRWAEGTTPTNSITLQLKADGENYGDPVVLNAANNWFCRWEDLPKYTAEQAPNGTPIVYTITEISIPGYQTSIVQTDPSQASASWTEAAALEDGKTYLLVTANGALAGRSDYQLQWLNVSNELLTGGTPIQAALWTYSSTGSTLRNGDGKYLVLGDLSGSYVFFTNTTSRQININNGRLSATGGSSTRYFTGNFNQYNYGITSNNSSEAIIFTLYTLENDTENWGETHYIVTNETEPSYVLPETGGPGTTWYTVGGILLITSALLLLYLYKKRREDTLTSC